MENTYNNALCANLQNLSNLAADYPNDFYPIEPPVSQEANSVSIFSLPPKQHPSKVSKNCTDGKDDGKISIKEKVKSMGKGALGFFKGMVCDENGFSIKRTLTTAAITAGAAALCVASGGAAAPLLIAAGAIIGTLQAGKGIYNAVTAKTDKEAKEAWENIGGGIMTAGLSVAGAKSALNAAGQPLAVNVATNSGKLSSAVSSVKTSLQATGECISYTGTQIVQSARGFKEGSVIFLRPKQSKLALSTEGTNVPTGDGSSS